ncbi:uncharacterized protein TRAVEDRAFT_47201 [Trametes versicolor FP-101664 SS1]|uniref:uncharacterized protein n=1 Tax=Trametes versicolor (strain FP-101664) TaxID=717944 RepID=UPI000462158C|nr:uncharacterized protein TRAVEDRAFT_47201 [Trametes versicolor FP-101664 SS1]EIW59899.1 hypothetical protein TRAVEDRAFT_47201 [Trametes versicolor FP-101664 SS1]
MIKYIDLALTPECREIIDVPMSEAVTIDDFKAVIPALAQKWEVDVRKVLTKHLLPYLGDIAEDVDPLELAISFSYSSEEWCTGPISIMRYPAILNHSCSRIEDCYRSGWYLEEDFLKEDLYTRTTKTLGTYAVDHESEIPGDDETSVRTCVPFHIRQGGGRGVVARMRRIVSAMGLDPARATFEELERCDVWLRCNTCETDNPNNAILAHSWSSAYEHDLRHAEGTHIELTYYLADSRKIPEWRHADEEDMIQIQAAKEARLSRAGGFYRCSCALCPDFDSSADAMVKHLATTHDISDFCQARRDGVVYLHPHTDRSAVFTGAFCLRERIKPAKAP